MDSNHEKIIIGVWAVITVVVVSIIFLPSCFQSDNYQREEITYGQCFDDIIYHKYIVMGDSFIIYTYNNTYHVERHDYFNITQLNKKYKLCEKSIYYGGMTTKHTVMVEGEV